MVDKDGTLCVGDHPARFRAAMYNGRQTLVLEGEGISRRWRDHGPNQNWTCKPPTREDAKGDDSTIFMRFFADSDVHLQRGITGEVVRPENGFYLEYVDQRSLGSGLAAAAAAAAVEGW